MSSLFFELTDFRYYPLPNSAENIVYSLFANDKVNIIIGNSFETYNGAEAYQNPCSVMAQN